MATKFGVNDAENYGGNSAGYFSLKDDGDSAIVRFMYNSLDDIEGYAVHRLEFGDKFRYVGCLREYNDPMEKCPLCANRNLQQAKFYFSVYDAENDEVRIWERGKQILKTLVPVLEQINGPICGTPIKITRHGKAGDQYTKYDFELLEADGCTLEDLPDPINPTEKIILSYSFDELNDYVMTGKLPNLDIGNNSSTNANTNSNTDSSIRRRYTPREDNGRMGTGNRSAF